MKTLLYLDDIRNPFFELSKDVQEKYRIVLVRNYKEFYKYIVSNEIPYIISFDHDLAPEHYTPEYFWSDYEASKKYQEFRKVDYKEQTGEGCAKFILKYCNDNDIFIPKTFVHSANPVGADWIKEVLPFNLIDKY